MPRNRSTRSEATFSLRRECGGDRLADRGWDVRPLGRVGGAQGGAAEERTSPGRWVEGRPPYWASLRKGIARRKQ